MIVYQFFLIVLFIVISALNSKIKSNIVFITSIVISVLLTCLNVLVGMDANVIPTFYIMVNIIVEVIYVLIAIVLAYKVIRKKKDNKVI